MPIKSSLGALRVPIKITNPIIGGTGWIGKLDTSQNARGIATPDISNTNGANYIYYVVRYNNLTPNPPYTGTNPPVIAKVDNTGTLIAQAHPSVINPNNSVLSVSGGYIYVVGTASTTEMHVFGIATSFVAGTEFNFKFGLSCKYADIATSGSTASGAVPFYTVSSYSTNIANNVRSAIYLYTPGTLPTVTRTWTRLVRKVNSGLELKNIYSDRSSPSGDIIVAGNLESLTGADCKIYVAKISSTNTIIWEKTYAIAGVDLRLVCFTESYFATSHGEWVYYDISNGNVISAATCVSGFPNGFTSTQSVGIVKTVTGEVSTLDIYGNYIPDLRQAFAFGAITARRITNLGDDVTEWSSINQIGTNSLSTNVGVVLGGVAGVPGVTFSAITMQVPFYGKIPYSGTYVIEGRTFTYEAIYDVSATDSTGTIIVATPTIAWENFTGGTNGISGLPETPVFTYNKINIGV